MAQLLFVNKELQTRYWCEFEGKHRMFNADFILNIWNQPFLAVTMDFEQSLM